MVRLHFKPDILDSVLARILPIARLTRAESGNIEFNVYRERDKKDRLLIFERWENQAALEHHWQQDYTKEALGIFEQYLLKPLSDEDDVTYMCAMIPMGSRSSPKKPIKAADL